MAERSSNDRVEILEQRVRELEVLPARVAAVETQILQLRGETRDGFSAIANRLDRIDQRLDGHDERLDALDRRFDNLERRMLESDEDTRRQMRVLHEDVVARISLLHETRGRRKR